MTIIYVKVKNLSGKNDSLPLDGSANWLDFWKEKNPFYAPSSCSNRECDTEEHLIGAHVRVAGEAKDYIIPLCPACSQLQDEFDVPEYKLIPAKSG